MFTEIEKIIQDVLGSGSDFRYYDVTISEEDGEFQLNGSIPYDLIRDLLLSYYMRQITYEYITDALVSSCRLDPLDIIELLGAVDALYEKNKSNL